MGADNRYLDVQLGGAQEVLAMHMCPKNPAEVKSSKDDGCVAGRW